MVEDRVPKSGGASRDALFRGLSRMKFGCDWARLVLPRRRKKLRGGAWVSHEIVARDCK